MSRRYDLIYADPAWDYEQKGKKGCIVKRDGSQIYRTSKFEEMRAMTFEENPEGCVLLMWITWPQIEKGVALMQEWGYVYEGIECVWYKVYDPSGKTYFAGGSYTAANTEVLCLGTKGRFVGVVTPSERRITAFRKHPTKQEHSSKPSFFYLYALAFAKKHSLTNLLEAFARLSAYPGFDFMGEEVDKYRGLTASHEMRPLVEATLVPNRENKRTRKDVYALSVVPEYFVSRSLRERWRGAVSDEGRTRLDVILLELYSVTHVLTLDFENAFKSANHAIVFRMPSRTLHLWINAIQSLGFVYRTLMFYVMDPADEYVSHFYGVATGKRTTIESFRAKHISQVLSCDEKSPTETVAEALRVSFGGDKTMRFVKSDENNDLYVYEI